MHVYDTIESKSFPKGMAVLVMNSVLDITAVEIALDLSQDGMLKKMASQLKAVKEQYEK